MRPLLLRLLLCTVLLLNGIGSAMASTHVALAASASGGHAAEHAAGRAHAPGDATTAAPASECPHGGAPSPVAAGSGAHAGHGPDDAPMAAGTDCLKLCLDICLQQCQAMLASALAGPPAAPRTLLSAARAEAPAADAAYPPLRPPIV